MLRASGAVHRRLRLESVDGKAAGLLPACAGQNADPSWWSKMPKGGGMFSPAAQQQFFATSPKLLRDSSPRSGASSSTGALVTEHHHQRVHVERERRQQIVLSHTQELQQQIRQREAHTRSERQRSHAAERTAMPATAPTTLRREPVPWAQDAAPSPPRRAPGDLKRVLQGEGHADSADAVWDTAKGIWRDGGSPRGSPGSSRGGRFDFIVEPPEGWSAADQQRLTEERASHAVEMETKWDDGLSMMSNALSELLDSLADDFVERMPSPDAEKKHVAVVQARRSSGGSVKSAATPVLLISREGLESKGRKQLIDARGSTDGLLYHRDGTCPIPAPVENNIAVYAKLIKSGGVITRGTASFMGVKQVSGKVNDYHDALQPIKISGPDNRILPEGMSRGRRSGSAGLPPKKAALPAFKTKNPKKKGLADEPRIKTQLPRLPEEAVAALAASGSTGGVSADQLAMLAAMDVTDIGSSSDDGSQPTPPASSDEEEEEVEEDPAAMASRLFEEAKATEKQQKKEEKVKREKERSKKAALVDKWKMEKAATEKAAAEEERQAAAKAAAEVKAAAAAAGVERKARDEAAEKDRKERKEEAVEAEQRRKKADEKQAALEEARAKKQRAEDETATKKGAPAGASKLAKSAAFTKAVAKEMGDGDAFAELMSMVNDSPASSDSEDEAPGLELPEAVPPAPGPAPAPTKPPPRPSKSTKPTGPPPRPNRKKPEEVNIHSPTAALDAVDVATAAAAAAKTFADEKAAALAKKLAHEQEQAAAKAAAQEEEEAKAAATAAATAKKAVVAAAAKAADDAAVAEAAEEAAALAAAAAAEEQAAAALAAADADVEGENTKRSPPQLELRRCL